MAGIGELQDYRRYKQSDPMDGMRSLAYLLQTQNESFKEMGEGIDKYGQGKGREALATLMATPEYGKLNPEQAQSKIMELTKGRDLGDAGKSILEQTYKNKGDIQDLAQDEQLRRLEHGFDLDKLAVQERYNIAGDARSHANTMERLSKYGEGSGKSGRGGKEELMGGENSNPARKAYIEEIWNTQDPDIRNKLIAKGIMDGTLSRQDRLTLSNAGLFGKNNEKQKINGVRIGQEEYNAMDPESRKFYEAHPEEVYFVNRQPMVRNMPLNAVSLNELKKTLKPKQK